MECGGSATAQIFGTTGGRTGTKAHQHHVWQIRRLEDLPDFRWMYLGDRTSLMPPRPHVYSFILSLLVFIESFQSLFPNNAYLILA